MNTSYLYEFAEENHITVFNFPLKENGSVSIKNNDKPFIGLDESTLSTSAEHRVHLAHEVGHCVTDSFYNRYTPLDVRQKHENKADKWAIKHLIPGYELDAAIADGYTEIWSLAEYFDVSEEFMRKTVCLHVYGNLAEKLYF